MLFGSCEATWATTAEATNCPWGLDGGGGSLPGGRLSGPPSEVGPSRPQLPARTCPVSQDTPKVCSATGSLRSPVSRASFDAAMAAWVSKNELVSYAIE